MATFSLGKLDAICARLKSSKQLKVVGSSPDYGRGETEKFPNHEKGEPDPWADKLSVQYGQDPETAGQVFPGGKSCDSVAVHFSGADLGVKKPSSPGEIIEGFLQKVEDQNSLITSDPEANNDSISIIPKNNNNNAEVTDYNELASYAHCATFQSADSTTADSTAADSGATDSLVSSTTADSQTCNEHIPTAASLLPEPSDAIGQGTTTTTNAAAHQPASPSTCCPPAQVLSSVALLAHPSTSECSAPPCENEPTGDVQSSSADDQTGIEDGKHCDPIKPAPASAALTPVTANGVPAVEDIRSSDDTPSSSSLVFSSTKAQVSSSVEIGDCLQHHSEAAFKESPKPCSTRERPFYEQEAKHEILDASHILNSSEQKIVPAVSSCPRKTNVDSPAVRDEGNEAINGFANLNVESSLQLSVQSDQSVSTVISSGRRKSRKAAKPQRQTKDRFCSDRECSPEITNIGEQRSHMDQNSDITSKDSGFSETSCKELGKSAAGNRCKRSDRIEVKDSFLYPSKSSSPLDLSVGNSSNNSMDSFTSELSLSLEMSSEEGTSFSADKTAMNGNPQKVFSNSNIYNRNYKKPKKKDFSRNVDRSRSELADSKGLVDFAHNTMNELLGIYGFEGGSDSKYIPFNDSASFQVARRTMTPTDEDKPWLVANVKEELDIKPASPSGGEQEATKTGSFRKKVYRSLGHHAMSTTTTNDDGSKKESTQQQGQANKVSAASKYAKSKKSYNQKVLSSADFNKYIKRYGTGTDCGGKLCQDLGYRDHYHCLDCVHKVFLRKEEMVRHYKWHKKRHDSLQQGFMRYSPMDDCSKKYGNCTHNGRQTHYHCVQRGCDKVYVSTSDVQMHANFHRKDSAIIQEGFQRFRATEDCGTTSCAFYGQRTTHFHCRRPQCNFTFKNKADMEKHKSYHQKDEVLSRDGFKKFMKYEVCQFNGCRYSKTSNHIHCIRPGCQYVLHSTAQLYSHKRKHERREFEQAYRSFRQTQQHTPASANVKTENTPRREVSANPVPPSPTAGSVLQLPVVAVANGQLKSAPGTVQAIKLGAMTPLKLPGDAGTPANSNPLNTKLVLPMLTGLTAAPLDIAKLADPQNLSKHDLHILTSAQPLPMNLCTPSAHVSEVLNLSSGRGRPGHVTVDSRQTMSLPIKLVKDESTVKNNMAVQEVDVKLEPEDLSMKGRQQSSDNSGIMIKEHAGISNKDLTGVAIKDLSRITVTDHAGIIIKDHADIPVLEIVGGPAIVEEANQGFEEPETHNFGDANEDDNEDDDDDDDDDDDKDYGQVEEPTLVNTFTSILEGGQVNESQSLSFPSSSPAVEGPTLAVQTGAKNHNGQNGATNGKDRLGGILSLSSQSESGSLQLQNQSPLSALQGGASEGPQALLSTKGKIMGVHLPLKLMPERRERDESWKKYLIRFTANDACFSRCACLYKDHYHCRMPGCQVIFKSKDGVRGHARFHDLQDSITPLVFCKFKADVACNSTQCQFNGKEDHYHCNWSNCSHTLAESAPTFARLDHYRIHECLTAAVSKGRSVFSSGRSELDPLQKRRGRPPKYPKYDLPSVPKVHLTEKEITDSTIAFMHNQWHENSTIINGFKKFVLPESCPDELCVFRSKDHYHCGRKFCHMSTDRLDVLNVHAKEFHNNITILEGFEFFERMVNCRRPVCHNNGINRHFHCMRSLCDYSFVRHSTMAQHNKKHPTVTSAVLSTPMTLAAPMTTMAQPKMAPSQYIAIAPVPCTSSVPKAAAPMSIRNSNKNVVKSAGTYYPMSGISNINLSAIPTLGTVMTSPVLTSAQAVCGSHSTQGSSAKVLPDSQVAAMNNVLGGSQITTGTTAQVMTGSHMSPVYSGVSNMVSGGQVFQSQAGASMFTAGGLCLTIPPNMVSTSIPVIAQTPMGQQPSVLTGLIPVGQLSQHGLSSPLINISAGQFLAAAQGHFLQQSKLMGTNVLQFIPSSSTNQTLTTSKPVGVPPLTVLLQHHQQLQQQGLGAPLSWAGLKKRMHYSVEHNCGRPFCKLKKKDHYHCLDCNQAFSDPARLRAHIGKHGFKFKKSGHSKNPKRKNDCEAPLNLKPIDLTLSRKRKQPSDEKDNESSDYDDSADDPVNLSLNLQPSVFTNMVTNSVASSDVTVTPPLNAWNSSQSLSGRTADLSKAHQNESEDDDCDDLEDLNSSNVSNGADSKHDSLSDSLPVTLDDSFDEFESPLNASSSSLTLCSSLSRKSGRKRTLAKNEDLVDSDPFVLPKPQKQKKMSWGIKVDGDIPEGYKRVRCGEDCGHVRCAYRQTVTHFHCLRTDCGYGFSDKSRIMQHRIRHERLDALMGGEFQQFRASVSCEQDDCEYDEKASHFHCLKCPYSCVDSSKVPAHRKYHSKLDNISSNGFTKYPGTSDCQIAACSYFRKQTHYHCTFAGCNHAVLGPSQMAPHKLKHAQLQSV